MKLRFTKYVGGFTPVYQIRDAETGDVLGTVQHGPAGMWVARAKGRSVYGSSRRDAAVKLVGK